MPLRIIKKSGTRKINFSVDETGKQSLTTTETKPLKYEMYKLEFHHSTTAFSPLIEQKKELAEYQCWINSPISKKAAEIGWTYEKKELDMLWKPGDMLYMPHNLYHSTTKSSEWLQLYCPHIQCLSPELSENTEYTTSYRNTHLRKVK